MELDKKDHEIGFKVTYECRLQYTDEEHSEDDPKPDHVYVCKRWMFVTVDRLARVLYDEMKFMPDKLVDIGNYLGEYFASRITKKEESTIPPGWTLDGIYILKTDPRRSYAHEFDPNKYLSWIKDVNNGMTID